MTLHSPHIRKEVDLSAFNTLGIHATAAGYIEITHRDQLPVLARRGLFNRGKYFILGGGSNVLFKDRLEVTRSEEHTSELQSRGHLVCRLLLEKKNINSE